MLEVSIYVILIFLLIMSGLIYHYKTKMKKIPIPDLRRFYKGWEAVHKNANGIASLKEYSTALQNYHSASSDFKSAIFRGEPALYDVKNTGYDTHLISKIARPTIIKGSSLSLYKHYASGDLNISKEEIEEIERFKSSVDYRLGPSSSNWIALAQHYGASTRLLDFTSAPLTALFFSCWKPDMEAGWDADDGMVFIVLPESLRPQSVSRDTIEPGDIEQGCPSSYFELFEPWSLSPVNDNVGHRYKPLFVDTEVNERLRAQNGMFIWWNPPDERMTAQIFPILIRSEFKAKILMEIAPLGYRPDVLFPDEYGAKQEGLLIKALETYDV